MRNLLIIIASLAIGSTVFAQGMSVQNAAGTAKCNTAGQSCPLSTDISGNLILGAPSVSATGLGKVEDTAVGIADTGVAALFRRSDSVAAITNTNGDYSHAAVNSFGANKVDLDSTYQATAANSPIIAEDTATANGQGLMLSGGIVSPSTQSTTAGDAVPFATDRYGAMYVDLHAFYQGDSTALNSPVRIEDTAFGDAHAVIVAGAQREDTLSVNTSGSLDVTQLKTDSVGRLITTFNNPGESFQSCGTATATTADVALKGAVASNRIYVNSITCKNTSATVATSIDFKDATTIIAVGGISQMAAGAAGSFTANFPTPLRGTVNTAFNFATNISVSSVTCCIAGYISVA